MEEGEGGGHTQAKLANHEPQEEGQAQRQVFQEATSKTDIRSSTLIITAFNSSATQSLL